MHSFAGWLLVYTYSRRYVRQYFSQQRGGRDSLWPWTHHPGFTKSWEAMFNTTDFHRAVALAEAEGFKAEWAHGDARVLKLSHDMPATRRHPVTGRTVWSNHLAVIQVGRDGNSGQRPRARA
jgi:hypothetical protein